MSTQNQPKDLPIVQAPPSRQQKEVKTDDQQMNYYNEFCRLYLTNTILTAQLKELNLQKGDLVIKLNRIQKRAEELSEGNSGLIDDKKRRTRRAASQIARHYKCSVEGCNKSYGYRMYQNSSQGSLNQHLKIKHVQVYKTMAVYLVGNQAVKESDQQDQSM